MPRSHDQKIEMIPINRITVLNPRTRNTRLHREIVENIETIGLKRPITVSRRSCTRRSENPSVKQPRWLVAPE